MAFILLLSAAPASVSADDAMSVFKQAMDKMNSDMQKGMDPDATKAWAKMMIAHHQGGIDMSRALLWETKDPTIRKMAEKTTEEQQKEIKQLEEWLSKHEK
jgi:uncharacterized protein (DUF305 family)